MEFTDIKGFKDKRIQMLKEAGINTPADLLLYFPSYYLYLNRLADLSKAEEDLNNYMLTIPNIPHPSVPAGMTPATPLHFTEPSGQ